MNSTLARNDRAKTESFKSTISENMLEKIWDSKFLFKLPFFLLFSWRKIDKGLSKSVQSCDAIIFEASEFDAAGLILKIASAALQRYSSFFATSLLSQPSLVLDITFFRIW